MTRAAAFACGLLVAVQPGFAQTEPDRAARDTTMVVDSLTHQEQAVESGKQQDSTAKVTNAVPRQTKLPIIEEHIFDLSTQPMSIGEKEFRVVPLGKRWEAAFAEKPATFSGAVMAGFGNYRTPLMHGWMGIATPRSDLLVRALFRSSDGPEQNRDVRSGEAVCEADWYLPEHAGMFAGGRVRTAVALHSDRYRLYGSTTPSQARSLNRLESDVTLTGAETGSREIQMLFTGTRLDDLQRAEQISIGGRMAARENVGRTMLTGELNVWKDFQNRLLGANPFFSSFSVHVQHRFARSVDVTGGAIVHYIDNAGDPLRWRLLPHASIVWLPTEALSVFAKYEPFVERQTLSGFAQMNPFVRSSLALRSTDVAVNATGGLAVEVSGVIKASASFTYRRVHGYPVFSSLPKRMWEVHYTGTTRIMSFESELYVEAGGNLVGMKVLLNDSRAEVKNTTAIPYLPKVSVTATARYRFFSRLLVASNVRYTGRRFADMQNVRSLPAYVLWDARIEFGERVLVGGEVTNILDTREGRWEGYAGEPRRIMLSLGYTW